MGNPALDQMIHALFSKAVPWMILFGGGGILLKESLRWLDRRATQFGKDRQAQRKLQVTMPPPAPNALFPRAPEPASITHSSLDTIGWENFELLTGELFRRQGYEVEITAALGSDGGKDLTLRRNGETRLVQCKTYARAIR